MDQNGLNLLNYLKIGVQGKIVGAGVRGMGGGGTCFELLAKQNNFKLRNQNKSKMDENGLNLLNYLKTGVQVKIVGAGVRGMGGGGTCLELLAKQKNLKLRNQNRSKMD